MHSNSNPHILVSDDERTIREMLELSLASHAFSVVAVGDGIEALRYLRERDVDAIVCDVM